MDRKIEFTVSLKVLNREELNEADKKLINMAESSMNQAYAPYSNFLVGASLLLENGQFFSANNQENVSFPVGICAERNVLSYAMANFPDAKPLKLAIVAKKRGSNQLATVTPCGLCRQAINEYEIKFQSPIEILILNAKGEVLIASGIEQFLPFRFNSLDS